jgi:hypothetical protein
MVEIPKSTKVPRISKFHETHSAGYPPSLQSRKRGFFQWAD